MKQVEGRCSFGPSVYIFFPASYLGLLVIGTSSFYLCLWHHQLITQLNLANCLSEPRVSKLTSQMCFYLQCYGMLITCFAMFSESFGLWNFSQSCWNAKGSTMLEADDWKNEIPSEVQVHQKELKWWFVRTFLYIHM